MLSNSFLNSNNWGCILPDLFIHPNLKLGSYSSDLTFGNCERKFYINKLTKQELDEEGESVTLSWGKVIGIGVQEYLISGERDAAIFKMFVAWKKYLDDESGIRQKKTFFHLINALDNFIPFRKTALAQYEMVYVNDVAAVELGFNIDLGDGFSNRGFLDAMLINRSTGSLIPFECKHTGLYTVDEAMYKNSAQGVGYGVVVDSIAAILNLDMPLTYDVLYCIYGTRKYEWEKMIFNKNNTQRALWIRNLLLDKQRKVDCASIGYWPMRGNACYSFGRECEHFGICELSDKLLFDFDITDIPVKIEDAGKYQFHFTVEQLINDQIKRKG